MTGNRPNLFIIGAMKSGTSSLHRYLGSHPAVFMSEPKEPGYFVEELTWPNGEAWYLNLFAGAAGRPIIGESSTEYAKAPSFGGVPERIARFNPEARFIYVMRDPVERAISHYWHMVVNNAEYRDMEQAVREDPRYREFSHYRMQLDHYIAIFGRERILAIVFEEMKATPVEVVQRVFRWLGIDDSFVPPNLGIRANVTPAMVERVRGRGYLHGFRFSRFWNTVGPHIPRSFRRLGRSLAEERVDRTSEPQRGVAEYLRPELLEQTIALTELLGREFPEWTTLHGSSPSTDPRSTKPLSLMHESESSGDPRGLAESC